MLSCTLGEHIPILSNSILLHPDTMRECGIVIASPVVIRRFSEEGEYQTKQQVVCKAWPLHQVSLDGG